MIIKILLVIVSKNNVLKAPLVTCLYIVKVEGTMTMPNTFLTIKAVP